VHDYACKVRDGIIDDPTFLPVIYAADPEDDWASPETWKKAHPGLGKSVQMEFLEAEAQKAKEVPAFSNTFMRLYLNIWTEQSVRWMPMEQWDACDLGPVTLETLAGREVYLGVDLSSTTDLTSVAIVAPPRDEDDGYQVVWAHFVPEDNIALRARRDRVDYGQWVRDGHIIATPGNVVDQAFIEKFILSVSECCTVREIAYDPWNSTALITRLQESGATCVQMRQGFFSMNAPVKEVLALVLSRRINHGGNPVARWCMSNAVVKEDPAANQKLDRAKSTEKIDACISLVMALGRAILHTDGGSVYDTRGLLVLDNV
jgi:phage terminase large subunit-like protein